MIPNKRRVLEASGNAGWLEEHNRRVDDAARGKQNAMCRAETLAAELRVLNLERDHLAAERDRLRVEWVEVNGSVPDIAPVSYTHLYACLLAKQKGNCCEACPMG